MPIRRHGRALFVDTDVSAYAIEPIRHTLGKTRVEMVDEHLAELCRTGRGHGAEADELLEAREQFTRAHHDYLVTAWAD
jgi:hypothetical protein